MNVNKKLTKLAFAVHSWLGMITGIFVLLLGLSGSALVFKDELDHLTNAKLLRVEPKVEKMPLDSMYRTICAEYPNLAGIAWLNPDAGPDLAYEFRLYQNDGKLSTYDLGMLSINPYNGEILRKGNLQNLSTGLLHWLIQFHWSFQLGVPGLLLATLFGITMFLSILTGLVIYRKYVIKVLLFRVRFKWNNHRTISSSLHRVVGVWAMIFNLLLFLTGFWMNLFSMQPSYWLRQTRVLPNNQLASQSMDVLFKKGKIAFPDLCIQNVYFPTQPGKNFRMSGSVAGQSTMLSRGNAVSLDPNTGLVIEVQRLKEATIWEKVEASIFPLHTGSFGNFPIKLFYVILGLLPGLLSITGAVLWWRRKKIAGK